MGSEMGFDRETEREMDVDLAPRAGSFPTDLGGHPGGGPAGSSVTAGPVADDAVAGPAGQSSTAGLPIPEMPRFYMTSDLRAATGLSRTHLDFYLREGIIVATARTESGYLLFDDRELARLRQVVGLRQSGVGIREIRQRLGR
ncbi:MAG: MerR family transcriptional regulator [Chloroflexota bacterium]|nr:MerR family transcriptional regulator [Chloroflexota bacterium]